MKSRLQICRCTLSGSTPTPTSLMFEAMVNPTGYDIKDVTEFGDFKPAKGGTLPGMVKLRKPSTFSIKDLVLDGTGVLTSGVAVEVKDLVGQLYKVAYDFEEQTNGTRRSTWHRWCNCNGVRFSGTSEPEAYRCRIRCSSRTDRRCVPRSVWSLTCFRCRKRRRRP